MAANKTISDFLNENSKTDHVSFHMPGHKRNKKFMYKNLLDLDFTEIYGLDNLQKPNGIIKKAESDCAKIFGCKKSFFVIK